MARKAKTHQQFVLEIEQLTNGEYEVLSEYARNSDRVKLRHSSCGYEWKVLPNQFLSGTRCPRCSFNQQRERRQQQVKAKLAQNSVEWIPQNDIVSNSHKMGTEVRL